MELTEKLKEDSKKESELHHQQMTNRNQKWKEHLDSKTSAFTACMEQEKQIFEATTNQTIKSYEAMNDQLRFENEAIKACCNSQAVQQAVMQQQITDILS
jgi:ribosomal protein L9